MRKKLLICGSRQATPAMLEYTRACVKRAYERDFFIVIGDAVGVDAAAAQAVIDFYNEPADLHNQACIYGLDLQPRHGIIGKGIEYKQIKEYMIITRGSRDLHCYTLPVRTFTDRDKAMVYEANMVMCIWNGTSKGTNAVFGYAKQSHKQAWLMDFGRNQKTA